MPPRKRGRGTVELANLPQMDPTPDNGNVMYAPLSPTEERRERELEEVLSELASDARIRVYQIIEGKTSYAGDMPADGFSLDLLLDAYGGGDKRLIIMQGKTRVETVSVSLDPSIPPKNPRAPRGSATPGTAGGGNMDILNIFGAMAQQQAQSASMMTQMMGGIIGALTTVMTATQRTDPVAQAVQIATVLKQDSSRGGGAVEAMQMFREGMQLAERYAGKGDDDGVMGVVGKGLDTLGVLVEGIVTAQKAKAEAQLNASRAPGALPNHANHEASAAAGDGGHVHLTHDAGGDVVRGSPLAADARPWVRKVHPNIGALVQASRFMPPAAAAQTIDSTLSDEEFEDMVSDITDQTNGGFGTRLKEYFPAEIEQINVEWLASVIEILLTEYVDDSDEPTGGAAGNGTVGA